MDKLTDLTSDECDAGHRWTRKAQALQPILIAIGVIGVLLLAWTAVQVA